MKKGVVMYPTVAVVRLKDNWDCVIRVSELETNPDLYKVKTKTQVKTEDRKKTEAEDNKKKKK